MNVKSPPIDAIIPFRRSGLVYITTYAGKLWDAAAGGRSKSVFAIGYGVQVSRMKNLSGAEGEFRRWPVDVGELRVPKADAVIGGHFVGESIKGARSHRFLLNKESA